MISLWFLLLTILPVRENSEAVIIYPGVCIIYINWRNMIKHMFIDIYIYFYIYFLLILWISIDVDNKSIIWIMANFSNPVTMDRVSTEKPWLLYIYTGTDRICSYTWQVYMTISIYIYMVICLYIYHVLYIHIY